MISYSAVTVFAPSDLKLLKRATEIVEAITSTKCYIKSTRDCIRCHEVARVVQQIIEPWKDMEVVDGMYRGRLLGVEHSWLRYRSSHGSYDAMVLDVYAVGSLPMVQLVDDGGGSSGPFVAGEERTDIDEDWVRSQERKQKR